MGRERMPQLVRSQLGVEPRRGEVTLQGELDRPPVELPPLRGNKKRLAVEGARVEISFQRADGGISQRAKSFLPALADDAHRSLVKIEIAPLDLHQFRKTQPGAVKKLEPRDVAE